jgi:hypothetical protein
MFDNENQNEELKAFEELLASLRPRADGLDRRWRFLLAQEAACNCNLAQSPSFSAGENGAIPFSPPLCSRCGEVISSGRHGKHRWAWPTAFSGMTAVAVALLVALVVQSSSQIAVTPGNPSTPVPSFLMAKNQADIAFGLAGENGLPRRPNSLSAETSYLSLRDQVLRYGVDSWRLPVSAVAAATITEHPISYREQLDRLLKQENPHGS